MVNQKKYKNGFHFGFAMKCSAARIDGKWVDVFKDPITDSGKTSKRGRFNDENLQTIFLNGKLVLETSFSEVRERAKL